MTFCIQKGCSNNPVYNFKGKKRLFCKNHKKDGMVNVINLKCQDCDKIPSFNFPNQKRRIFCNSHKKPGMINIVSKLKCVEKECEKYPTFNFIGKKKRLYCKIHKKSGMIDVANVKCIEDDCNKYPFYNFPDKQKRLYCTQHKKLGMVDLANPTCKFEWCNTRIIKKYNGYCYHCFVHTFPEHKLSKSYKSKEKEVIKYVKSIFKNIDLVCDKTIQGGCSKRRPDIYMDMGSHVIIIEIDENQHIPYEEICENKRIMEISKDINHRPLIVLRFNPDSYVREDGKKISTCWKNTINGTVVFKSREKEWNIRLTVLNKRIQYWLQNVPTKIIEVEYLFYSV